MPVSSTTAVERIAREWTMFRAATETVVASLRSRISMEEQILYAHAERVAQRRAAA